MRERIGSGRVALYERLRTLDCTSNVCCLGIILLTDAFVLWRCVKTREDFSEKSNDYHKLGREEMTLLSTNFPHTNLTNFTEISLWDLVIRQHLYITYLIVGGAGCASGALFGRRLWSEAFLLAPLCQTVAYLRRRNVVVGNACKMENKYNSETSTYIIIIRVYGDDIQGVCSWPAHSAGRTVDERKASGRSDPDRPSMPFSALLDVAGRLWKFRLPWTMRKRED